MRHRAAWEALRRRWFVSLALFLLAGCGSGPPSAPAPPGPTTATPTPGTLSTAGPESVAIGELYTSNWRSDDFRGTALRVWTTGGDSFFFRWTTTAGDQIGRIGRTHPSPTLGMRVDDVESGTVMSTTAEAKDVASGGFYIWSIYGWTHSEYAGWAPPHGWNNEFYVVFRSWNGAYGATNTDPRNGYLPIGSVRIDGADFDGFVHDMPWGTPNQTQWVLEARAPSWTGSVDLSKAFAFWRSRGLPNEYVVDITWALEAGAGSGATSGEVQLTRIVLPPLAR